MLDLQSTVNIGTNHTTMAWCTSIVLAGFAEKSDGTKIYNIARQSGEMSTLAVASLEVDDSRVGSRMPHHKAKSSLTNLAGLAVELFQDISTNNNT